MMPYVSNKYSTLVTKALHTNPVPRNIPPAISVVRKERRMAREFQSGPETQQANLCLYSASEYHQHMLEKEKKTYIV